MFNVIQKAILVRFEGFYGKFYLFSSFFFLQTFSIVAYTFLD